MSTARGAARARCGPAPPVTIRPSGAVRDRVWRDRCAPSVRAPGLLGRSTRHTSTSPPPRTRRRRALPSALNRGVVDRQRLGAPPRSCTSSTRGEVAQRKLLAGLVRRRRAACPSGRRSRRRSRCPSASRHRDVHHRRRPPARSGSEGTPVVADRDRVAGRARTALGVKDPSVPGRLSSSQNRSPASNTRAVPSLPVLASVGRRRLKSSRSGPGHGPGPRRPASHGATPFRPRRR